MSVATLAGVIGQLLALTGIGVLLRMSGLLSAEDAHVLNTVIIYAGLPALVFRAVRQAQLSWELLGVVGIAWLVLGIGFGLAWLVAKPFHFPKRTLGGFLMVAALGNTGYIGYPLASLLLGKTGLVRAVFYDVFGTVIALLTVGILIASRFGTSEEKPNLARELLAAPALLAVVLALLTRPVPIPAQVSSGLDLLASLVVPSIMISLGLTLRPRAIGTYAGPIAAVAGIKLVALPLIAVALGMATLHDAGAVRLVALEAGAPAMMLTLVYGTRFGLDTEFVASAILVTTAAAVVSIPLIQALVR